MLIKTKLPMDARDRATQLFLQHYQYVAAGGISRCAFKKSTGRLSFMMLLFSSLKSQRSWNLEEDVRPLLRSITENMALKYWRDRMRTMPPFVVELMEHVRADLSAVVDKNSIMEDRLSVLNLCIKKLTPRNQKILQLFYFEQTPLTEVATLLGIKLSTLRKAICRIRECPA